MYIEDLSPKKLGNPRSAGFVSLIWGILQLLHPVWVQERMEDEESLSGKSHGTDHN